MLLAKRIKLTESQIKWLGFFVVVFLLSRFLGLRTDSVNPDGVNWHYRSQQFIVGLKSGDFEKTYQHYHPGVTLMWITGVPIEIYKQITGIQYYDQSNFLDFHLIAKSSLVIAQLFLLLTLMFFMSKFLGFWRSLLIISLLSFEPFFLGNSRIYHMDAIFTLLLFLGLVFLNLFYETEKHTYALLTGVVSGLVFLTKSLGIGLFLFSLFVVLYKCYKRRKYRDIVYFVVPFFVTTFLLFPALWVKPVYYLNEIFSEGERVGVRKGHSQIFFGEVSSDPGMFFYPIVIMLKFTPLILIGALFGLRKKYRDTFSILLLIFYAGYFVVMTIPTKKIDRYMVTLFPLFAYFAGCWLYDIYQKSHKMGKPIGFLLGVFILYPLIRFYPYYFTYTSPLFLNPGKANNVVGQKTFGMGIVPLRDFLIDRYGSNIRMGFLDTKPMKAVYSNSKVVDIRVAGTDDYDLLILGINEDAPKGILDGDSKFIFDTSYNINGLEYWRVYVKKDN